MSPAAAYMPVDCKRFFRGGWVAAVVEEGEAEVKRTWKEEVNFPRGGFMGVAVDA